LEGRRGFGGCDSIKPECATAMALMRRVF
jgi:hypothetical protein